ncbi:MAG: C-terminal binding protein [Planctomycetota bacterium]|nr:C-terminal binding protein [Planctomycetota bacterium]
MKVVITDFTFPDLAIEQQILQEVGASITSGQCKTPESLLALVADADAVITQFAPVSAHVIDGMQKARVIVRYGIGVDNVDLEAARRRGIPVCNVPDYCIDEVADHTLAFILAATRGVVPNARKVQQGGWGLALPLTGMRAMRTQCVGIVGFGRIGREVAARLRPFKCRVLVHDPLVSAENLRESHVEPSDLASLLKNSDIVTLHCPSNSATRHLLNADSLPTMKPGAILVNLGRGDLIETTALVSALQSGHLGAAALDVFEQEPLPADSPLRTLDNVVTASHVASVSEQAVRTLRETAAGIAAQALRGQKLPNVVNNVV